MSLVLRCVDESGEMTERFMNFIYFDKGIEGKALSNKIISYVVNEFSLDFSDCRGQCFDGAANISIKYSGIVSHIYKVNCASHMLNLCGASACQIQFGTNMMQNVTMISKPLQCTF